MLEHLKPHPKPASNANPNWLAPVGVFAWRPILGSALSQAVAGGVALTLVQGPDPGPRLETEGGGQG